MRRALVAAVVLLAGCGGGDETIQRGGTTAGGRATGGGLAIGEALEREASGRVLVKGSLVVRGGEMRLCSGFAGSEPPQCAEPSLRVVGLELGRLEGLKRTRLERSQGVTWSEGEVELRGEITNGVLRVRELPG